MASFALRSRSVKESDDNQETRRDPRGRSPSRDRKRSVSRNRRSVSRNRDRIVVSDEKKAKYPVTPLPSGTPTDIVILDNLFSRNDDGELGYAFRVVLRNSLDRQKKGNKMVHLRAQVDSYMAFIQHNLNGFKDKSESTDQNVAVHEALVEKFNELAPQRPYVVLASEPEHAPRVPKPSRPSSQQIMAAWTQEDDLDDSQ